MHIFDDFDFGEMLALLLLGGMGIGALFMEQPQLTNTAISLIGGYLAKGMKNGAKPGLPPAPPKV